MSSARQQAARWFTRLLDLPADHPERQAFQAWLAADPRHAAEYQVFSELWGDFSSTPKTAALAGAMESLGRRRFVRNGLLGLAALSSLASLLTLRYRALGDLQLVTGIGERRRETLSDGSQLVLDAATRIHVTFTEHGRQLFLLQGRAIFDVRPDPQRPFTVEAGVAQVRVLGTRFVVERFERRVQVSVDRGRVEFGSARQRLVLERDQVAEADERGQVQRIQRAAAGAFSFEQGSLTFDRADLVEIAAGLSRYRQRPLRVEGRSSLSLTAVVQTADVDTFLHSLPQLAAVRVEERGSFTVLVTR